MTNPPARVQRKLGQTYIGVIIAVGILAILSHALYTLMLSSYEIVSFSRSRISAMHIAEQKMEYLKNLQFAALGTVGGIPSGTIPQNETIALNGNSYNVRTTIVFVDDPFDNLAPSDLLPTDYKRVRVEVSWTGLGASNSNPIVLITDIAPKGIETTSGGGTISVLVFDSQGLPISQANVTFVNTTVTPNINLTIATDTNGMVILPGAPACNSCYRISATKSGFSTDRTYAVSEVANPSKPDATVIIGQLTALSFTIDRTSTLVVNTVSTRESGFIPIPNVTFQLKGNKLIGTDSTDNPVYKFTKTYFTGSTGTLTIADLEWDNYTLTPIAPSTFDVTGSNPLQPFSLLPATNLTVTTALSGHTSNSLLVTFTDPAGNPVASVTAHVTATGFDETKESGQQDAPDWGQLFFGGINALIYHLSASSSAYIQNDSDIPVSGTTNQTIVLTPQ